MIITIIIVYYLVCDMTVRDGYTGLRHAVLLLLVEGWLLLHDVPSVIFSSAQLTMSCLNWTVRIDPTLTNCYVEHELIRFMRAIVVIKERASNASKSISLALFWRAESFVLTHTLQQHQHLTVITFYDLDTLTHCVWIVVEIKSKYFHHQIDFFCPSWMLAFAFAI